MVGSDGRRRTAGRRMRVMQPSVAAEKQSADKIMVRYAAAPTPPVPYARSSLLSVLTTLAYNATL